jgi:hypothetical protein
MAKLETIKGSPGASVVGGAKPIRGGRYLPSINDSNRYQQQLSTVTSLIR